MLRTLTLVTLTVLIAASSVFMQKKSMNVETAFMAGKSPIVSLRLQFRTGSIADPKGKEGLACLTAAMLAGGGSKTKTYDEIVNAFYPIASGFSYQCDKEMITFVGSTHADNQDKYYSIIRGMLFDPGFRADDFERLKNDAMNFLSVSLREGNDEELGKERMYNLIYTGHPYESHAMGRVSALKSITLEDIRAFYKANFTRTNAIIGLAGGFSTKFSKEIYADFQQLPASAPKLPKIVAPKVAPVRKIDIVERETRATAISMGFPIAVTRAHKDFPALAVVASYFGQHRSSNSYLYGQIREKRGLNYGDYSYIEYFPRGMYQFEPDANLARRQQIFQMWIRPVEPQNANFTLRAALFEYDKLVMNGMSKEDFESTKQFLSKYVNILTATKDAELGYLLDSKFYGIGDYNAYMKAALAKLTLADVNRAIKTHLGSKAMQIVMITKDAKGLRDQIANNTPGTITYASPKPKEITDEDAVIAKHPFGVNAENITITPIGKVFE